VESQTNEKHSDDDPIGILDCLEAGSQYHNVPIQFTGKRYHLTPEEKKNTTPREWKCQREGESFSCRAID
jgi:hypothetical protein